MASTIGRVQYLKLSTTIGFVVILRETPTGINVPPIPPGPPTELFVIWSDDVSVRPRDLFTPELSRALANGLRVRITHEAHSSFISELVVFAPFEEPVIFPD